MTEQEYRTQKDALEAQKADIDAQIATLDAEYSASVNAYPCWLYHETEGSVVVNSEAEAEALGAGWSTSPGGPTAGPTAKAKAPAKPADEKKRAAEPDRLS